MSGEPSEHASHPDDGGTAGRWRGKAARRRGTAAVVAVLGAVGALAGCGGPPSAAGTVTSGPPAPASASGSPSAVPDSTAPDPNAPEVNAAGDIPDNQVFVPFTPPGATFSVSVPQGWAQSAQSAQGATTVFTDKYNSVRIDARPQPAAPDVASVRAQDVPPLQASVPGFALGDVQAVQRSPGPAVLLTYTATSAPNAVTGKSVTEAVERYAFWHGGQEVLLTLSGPSGADNVDPWRKITDSLVWQR